jgi:hypothetical protein
MDGVLLVRPVGWPFGVRRRSSGHCETVACTARARCAGRRLRSSYPAAALETHQLRTERIELSSYLVTRKSLISTALITLCFGSFLASR